MLNKFKNNNLIEFDNNIKKEYKTILGLDEVGRGCVAGPLVVCGLILKNDYINEEIMDSKKIKTIEKRAKIALDIINNSQEFEYLIFDGEQVDKYNPKQCSKMGMKNICLKLKNKFDIALTDFEKIDIENIKQLNLKHGDATSYTIAAASICAKYIRDLKMIELDKLYPNYKFLKHHGYLTKEHKEILLNNPIMKGVYRFSYKYIKELSEKKGI